MDKILKEKTEQWMTLERKTLEQRKKAEQFYEEEMMEHIVREYIRNNKSKLKEKAKYLIVSVGTSHEPIVLNISLLQPERILFLYTSQSEEILDKVMDFCCLRMSQVEKSKVNETNQTFIVKLSSVILSGESRRKSILILRVERRQCQQPQQWQVQ